MPKKPKGFRAFDKLARKLVKVPALGNGVRVKIVGKHPHAGCEGVISGNVHTSQHFPDWRMWRVALEETHVGVDECFAPEKELKRLD